MQARSSSSFCLLVGPKDMDYQDELAEEQFYCEQVKGRPLAGL